MANKKVAILPGDGIGPEVVKQAIKVIQSVNAEFGHSFDMQVMDFGAISIENHGLPLTETVLAECKASDAVLLGAIGDPKYDHDLQTTVRPEQGLLQLRKSLQLYSNLRPIKVYPSISNFSPLKNSLLDGVDILFVRELIGGIYFGKKTLSEDKKSASDLCSYTDDEIKRIARIGFEEAFERKKKLTLVDKANVLETSRLWRRVVQEMSNEYPEINVDYMYVDNAAMQLMLNPRQFDVIITSNMFGDILSDLGSVLGGSIGLLPSASKGPNNALFEPIHGSYPQAKGLDKANPLATILAAAMMYHYFGMFEECNLIERFVAVAIEENILTEDLNNGKYLCSQVGDWVAKKIKESSISYNQI